MNILVVDDEKIKRITLADDLAAQGHEVVVAADGEEALEKLAAERFDVVVTDLKMPKLDGIELLKQIKQGPAADMEVIMMTAYGSIPVAVEAMKLGAFDFLTKPFRNDDVFPLLARIQRQREAAALAALCCLLGLLELVGEERLIAFEHFRALAVGTPKGAFIDGLRRDLGLMPGGIDAP